MSTVAEIENAIDLLPAPERDALEARLLARRFRVDSLDDNERARLDASLDAAEREIDTGRFLFADQLCQKVPAWAGR